MMPICIRSQVPNESIKRVPKILALTILKGYVKAKLFFQFFQRLEQRKVPSTARMASEYGVAFLLRFVAQSAASL